MEIIFIVLLSCALVASLLFYGYIEKLFGYYTKKWQISKKN